MAARLVCWLVVLSSAVAVAFAGWVWLLPAPNGLPPLSRSQDGAAVLSWGGLGVAWAATGAVLVTTRPRNVLGWLLLGIGASQAWHVGLVAYGIHGLTVAEPAWPGALWAGYVGSVLFVLGVLATPTLLLAMYPEGRLSGVWARGSVVAAVVAIVHLAAQGLFQVIGDPRMGQVVVIVPDFLQGVPARLLPPSSQVVQPVWTTDERLPAWAEAIRDGYLPVTASLWVPLFVASMLAIWAGAVVRLLRARWPHRQQLAWLVCVVLPVLIAAWLAPGVGRLLALVALLLVPVAVAVGVLRYQLLGIEAVLRRGLVYGVLTAAVFGLYLVTTALAGTALDRRPLSAVLVAALVAIGLAPARDWVQRAADRLVYGERRDPLRAINRLGQQLASAGELELLPAALASVTDAVRAPGALVTTPDGRVVGSVGTTSTLAASVPLNFGGDPVGELVVAGRWAGERYTGPQRQLLSAMASQVAVVVRALELTEALQAERDRVVSATRNERDRLRRDLHDGLGPSLSGVGLGLQALADRQASAGPATAALLDRLQAEVTTTVAEVRRIIDNLRPAALDTLSLTEAVRKYADTVSAALPVHVEAVQVPRLPPDVETAAYRITTEALTNAARHAGAGQVRVMLAAADGSLRITVADDGRWVPTATAGVGLSSMRRRAESLGGHLDVTSTATGTVVTATLPLERP